MPPIINISSTNSKADEQRKREEELMRQVRASLMLPDEPVQETKTAEVPATPQVSTPNTMGITAPTAGRQPYDDYPKLRMAGALASRIGSGFLSNVGGPVGAIVSGAGETLAQNIESPDPVNKTAIAVEAGLGAVPLKWVAKAIKAGVSPVKQAASNALRMAGLIEGGNMIRRAVEGENPLPDTLGEAAFDIGTIGLGGGLAYKYPPKPKTADSVEDLIKTASTMPQATGSTGRADLDELIKSHSGGIVSEPRLVKTKSGEGVKSTPTGVVPLSESKLGEAQMSTVTAPTERTLGGAYDTEVGVTGLRVSPGKPVDAGALGKKGRTEELPKDPVAYSQAVNAKSVDYARLPVLVQKQLDEIDARPSRVPQEWLDPYGKPITPQAEQALAHEEAAKELAKRRVIEKFYAEQEVKPAAQRAKAEDSADREALRSRAGGTDVGKIKADEAKAQQTAINEVVDKEKAHTKAADMVAKEQKQAAAKEAIERAKAEHGLEPTTPSISEVTESVPTKTGKQSMRTQYRQPPPADETTGAELDDFDPRTMAPRGPLPVAPTGRPPIPKTDPEVVAKTKFTSHDAAVNALAGAGKRGQIVGTPRNWRVVFDDDVAPVAAKTDTPPAEPPTPAAPPTEAPKGPAPSGAPSGAAAKPVDPEQAARNAAAKAEAAAEGNKAPYSEPAYAGKERRSTNRVSTPEEDAKFRAERERMAANFKQTSPAAKENEAMRKAQGKNPPEPPPAAPVPAKPKPAPKPSGGGAKAKAPETPQKPAVAPAAPAKGVDTPAPAKPTTEAPEPSKQAPNRISKMKKREIDAVTRDDVKSWSAAEIKEARVKYPKDSRLMTILQDEVDRRKAAQGGATPAAKPEATQKPVADKADGAPKPGPTDDQLAAKADKAAKKAEATPTKTDTKLKLTDTKSSQSFSYSRTQNGRKIIVSYDKDTDRFYVEVDGKPVNKEFYSRAAAEEYLIKNVTPAPTRNTETPAKPAEPVVIKQTSGGKYQIIRRPQDNQYQVIDKEKNAVLSQHESVTDAEKHFNDLEVKSAAKSEPAKPTIGTAATQNSYDKMVAESGLPENTVKIDLTGAKDAKEVKNRVVVEIQKYRQQVAKAIDDRGVNEKGEYVYNTPLPKPITIHVPGGPSYTFKPDLDQLDGALTRFDKGLTAKTRDSGRNVKINPDDAFRGIVDDVDKPKNLTVSTGYGGPPVRFPINRKPEPPKPTGGGGAKPAKKGVRVGAKGGPISGPPEGKSAKSESPLAESGDNDLYIVSRPTSRKGVSHYVESVDDVGPSWNNVPSKAAKLTREQVAKVVESVGEDVRIQKADFSGDVSTAEVRGYKGQDANDEAIYDSAKAWGKQAAKAEAPKPKPEIENKPATKGTSDLSDLALREKEAWDHYWDLKKAGASNDEIRAAGKAAGELRAEVAKATKEAAARGEPIPTFLQKHADAPPAAPKAAKAPTGKGPTNEDIAKMSPEEQEATLQKLVDEFKNKGKKSDPEGGTTLGAGFGGLQELLRRDPELFARVGLSTLGALAGADATPDDPISGAILGGAVGFGGAVAFRTVLRRYNTLPSGKAKNQVGKALQQKVKDTLTGFWNTLPDYYRASYLAKFPNLPINALVGPYGAAFMGATEAAMAGDPRGWKALKEFTKLKKNFKDLRPSYEEAKLRVSDSRERGDIVSDLGTGKLKAIVTAPATTMTTGDVGARRLLMRAGFTEHEARAITLTSEPHSGFAKSAGGFRKAKGPRGVASTVSKMMLPFYRTAVNQIEQSAMRLPGAGKVLREHWNLAPVDFRKRAVQGGLSATVGLGSLYLGTVTPPEYAPAVLKFVNNFFGPYGATASAMYLVGTSWQKKEFLEAAPAGLWNYARQGVPLPTIDVVQDWINFAGDYLAKGEVNPPYGTIPPPISSRDKYSIPTAMRKVAGDPEWNRPTKNEYSLLAPFIDKPKLAPKPKTPYEQKVNRLRAERAAQRKAVREAAGQ